ncbi:836_t:CDS:2, partial [Cetraspora pellucida]
NDENILLELSESDKKLQNIKNNYMQIDIESSYKCSFISCSNIYDYHEATDASEATTSAVPVTPFTDFTNLNMLFQPHYPTFPFFMNPLVLNKATAEHQEASLSSNNYVNQKKSGLSKIKLETTSELTSNDDSVSDT